MRIAIDTRCLHTARTGVRAYVEGLLPALARVAPQHDYALLTPARGPRPGRSALDKVLNHLGTVGWTELGLPLRAARSHADVLLSLEYASPLVAHCPRVVVFHDAFFWSNASHYNRWWRLLQDALTLPAARSSARIITVSEYARVDIARHTGLSLDHMVAIHEAPKPRTSGADDPAYDGATLERYGLRGKAYILHVGVLEKRKNLPLLVEAVARCLPALTEPLYLVLAGQPGPKTDMDDTPAIRATIARHGLEQVVLLPGFVPDADVPALYRGCRALAFPSLQEGFGIPILEAFSYGAPVLAARATSLPEIGGDAALYFDPTDADALADCLHRVVSEPLLRADMVARGRERVSLFSWERTARGVLDVLEQVVADNKRRRPERGSHA